MPHYLVEVRERADAESFTRTRPSFWTHMRTRHTTLGTFFEVEGRSLEVTHVEEGESPFDQRLVCVPVE
jgi:hypothetical protein